MSRLRIARVYDDPAPEDGLRLLVDRLWPRGLSKEAAALDGWCKDVAPSTELRTWYAHDPARFAEFAERYLAELDADPGPLDDLRSRVAGVDATLLTATKDLELSQAAVLRDILGSS